MIEIINKLADKRIGKINRTPTKLNKTSTHLKLKNLVIILIKQLVYAKDKVKKNFLVPIVILYQVDLQFINIETVINHSYD